MIIAENEYVTLRYVEAQNYLYHPKTICITPSTGLSMKRSLWLHLTAV